MGFKLLAAVVVAILAFAILAPTSEARGIRCRKGFRLKLRDDSCMLCKCDEFGVCGLKRLFCTWTLRRAFFEAKNCKAIETEGCCPRIACPLSILSEYDGSSDSSEEDDDSYERPDATGGSSGLTAGDSKGAHGAQPAKASQGSSVKESSSNGGSGQHGGSRPDAAGAGSQGGARGGASSSLGESGNPGGDQGRVKGSNGGDGGSRGSGGSHGGIASSIGRKKTSYGERISVGGAGNVMIHRGPGANIDFSNFGPSRGKYGGSQFTIHRVDSGSRHKALEAAGSQGGKSSTGDAGKETGSNGVSQNGLTDAGGSTGGLENVVIKTGAGISEGSGAATGGAESQGSGQGTAAENAGSSASGVGPATGGAEVAVDVVEAGQGGAEVAVDVVEAGQGGAEVSVDAVEVGQGGAEVAASPVEAGVEQANTGGGSSPAGSSASGAGESQTVARRQSIFKRLGVKDNGDIEALGRRLGFLSTGSFIRTLDAALAGGKKMKMPEIGSSASEAQGSSGGAEAGAVVEPEVGSGGGGAEAGSAGGVESAVPGGTGGVESAAPGGTGGVESSASGGAEAGSTGGVESAPSGGAAEAAGGIEAGNTGGVEVVEVSGAEPGSSGLELGGGSAAGVLEVPVEGAGGAEAAGAGTGGAGTGGAEATGAGAVEASNAGSASGVSSLGGGGVAEMGNTGAAATGGAELGNTGPAEVTSSAAAGGVVEVGNTAVAAEAPSSGAAEAVERNSELPAVSDPQVQAVDVQGPGAVEVPSVASEGAVAGVTAIDPNDPFYTVVFEFVNSLLKGSNHDLSTLGLNLDQLRSLTDAAGGNIEPSGVDNGILVEVQGANGGEGSVAQEFALTGGGATSQGAAGPEARSLAGGAEAAVPELTNEIVGAAEVPAEVQTSSGGGTEVQPGGGLGGGVDTANGGTGAEAPAEVQTGAASGGAIDVPVETASGGAVEAPAEVSNGRAIEVPAEVQTASGGAAEVPAEVQTGGAVDVPVETASGGAAEVPAEVQTGASGGGAVDVPVETASGGAAEVPAEIQTGTGNGGVVDVPVETANGGAAEVPAEVLTGGVSGGAVDVPVETPGGGAEIVPEARAIGTGAAEAAVEPATGGNELAAAEPATQNGPDPALFDQAPKSCNNGGDGFFVGAGVCYVCNCKNSDCSVDRIGCLWDKQQAELSSHKCKATYKPGQCCPEVLCWDTVVLEEDADTQKDLDRVKAPEVPPTA